jgi:hypothetical protein
MNRFPRLIRCAVLAITLLAAICPASPLFAADDNDVRIVGLPFKRGYWGLCSRSTRKGHGWVFNLREGPPVVAAAAGRVFQINEPLGILVDHGEGHYGAYMINGRWESEVLPGELIGAGTELADIDTRGNRKGRGAPMLNFSMRGPRHEQTHDLLFRLSGSKRGIEINKKTKYLSGTRKGVASGGSFKDSLLKGNEFRSNGVVLTSENLAFWLKTGVDVAYKGKVLEKNTKAVVLQVWQKKEEVGQELVYSTEVPPNPDGTFTLVSQIPASIHGSCSYRLAAKRGTGALKGSVKLQAGATSTFDSPE